MRIVQINTFPHKATGGIMMGIHRLLTRAGHDSYVVWGRGRESQNAKEISIKDGLGLSYHVAYTRITDRTGFASWSATNRLLRFLDEVHPDIIHLHNIHGYYLNIEMLFNYIRRHGIKVVWTMHDCWAITGHCAYFDMVGCKKWMNGCSHCEQKHTYPASKMMDSSKWNWLKKKELFMGLNITIVTPSRWLKGIFEQSFMKDYPIHVIYNGVDIDVFKPTYYSELREKYCPKDKTLVLGVASEWTERKGLADIVSLSMMAKDMNFVVVGLTKSQIKQLPSGIIGIERTNNVQELVGLYSVADVYFNPTYEDNFPTTNLEALACGTPIVTYDTGGSPESIRILNNLTSRVVGKVVRKDSPTSVNLNNVLEAIKDVTAVAKKENGLLDNANLKIHKVISQEFDINTCMRNYLELYSTKINNIKLK